MSKKRSIIHIDMDAFYAAVEQRDKPELQGKPVIIGGRPSERGVVSTASYEARAYGIRSAMPMAEAYRLCPNGVYLRGNHAKYRQVSEEIFKIYKEYSPLVETLALDEAFLDVTGCEKLFGEAEQIGKEIKARIKKELDLTASVGIGPNKFIAKLASDLEKPDGFVVVSEEKVQNLLNPLPVSRLWGAGKRTVETLNAMGIKTIGEAATLPLNLLENKFGQLGKQIYLLAKGFDCRPVEPGREVKSIGHETTFLKDVREIELLEETLLELTQWIGWRLRKKSLEGRTITLKLRTEAFDTITRSFSLPEPTDLDEEIYSILQRLLQANYQGIPIRLIGGTISNLSTKGEARQLSLFTEAKVKKEKITEVLDKLKDRYGETSVTRARLLKGRQVDKE